MGKKASAGKDRKLKRKEESAKVLEAQNLIKRLNENSDILASLPAFRSFNRNGLDASLACATSRDLPKPLADELFAVCKQNMEAAYDAAWGWSDGAKRAELTHDAARFILVWRNKRKSEEGKEAEKEEGEEKNAEAVAEGSSSSSAATTTQSSFLSALAADPSDLLAYVHYRFETDEGTQRPILYVYEIQLREGAETRRKGLGRFLMQLLELAARRTGGGGGEGGGSGTGGLEAITLTVQDSNRAAAALYASLGYVRDPCSPCPLEEPEAGYTILTKPLPPPAPKRVPLATAAGGNGKGATSSSSASAAPASSKAGVAAAAAALARAAVSSPAAAAVGQ